MTAIRREGTRGECADCKAPGFTRGSDLALYVSPRNCTDCAGSGIHYSADPRGLDHDCASCDGSGARQDQDSRRELSARSETPRREDGSNDS